MHVQLHQPRASDVQWLVIVVNTVLLHRLFFGP